MATIKDIAKLAGVSTATVSRILNDKGGASAEMIARVKGIAQAVNYRPNDLARSLSRGNSSLVAVMIPDLSNPFFPELVHAIEQTCIKHHLEVLICNTMDRRDKIDYFLGSIADNHALGAVICTHLVKQEDLSWLEQRGVHTITTDRSSFDHPYSAVNIDQARGTFIATKRLIDKGRKHIMLVGGPPDEQANNRESGYHMALTNSDLDFEYIAHGDYTLANGYAEVTAALAKHTDIDGIISTNDLMAIGAMRACSDLRRSVPADISIIGNDDISIDDYLTPRLSSLSQRTTEVAQLIIEELLSVTRGNAHPRKITLEPELILRDSD
ncbi:LacI family DNA-binding transcriptional regulator [Bifidobacterium dentium]|uniref:LacI family DNA-binding transcriptional regulator n=1 Tax=Bifidobacterium dentium TaxID=1689 RepID=UPI0018B0C572|nr:LacI family DNA-binding transcriptional regulator [Bifidobacterium dentium]MBF9692920.1 LacI family DNA-binding transcriptional regulator [Bifidobacterium dentium]MBF9698979.1 LacI family DNA-binding transcriptional regulator [Bifidobacterium dentium]